MSNVSKAELTPERRKWFKVRFEKRCAKHKWSKREGRTQFWRDVGEKYKEDFDNYLFSCTDKRCIEWKFLDKALVWIGASRGDFLAAGKTTNQGDDFFRIVAENLEDALKDRNVKRIDKILRLIDAIILTQDNFTVVQLKLIIFFISEFLHMFRDRVIQSVPIKGIRGYNYGWHRLWLWMRHVISVIKKEAKEIGRDANTGINLELFIPWCELICVKMTRHKLFFKRKQGAPKELMNEIKDIVRISFLQSLCLGAEYYFKLKVNEERKYIDSINELHEIKLGISNFLGNEEGNEEWCRKHVTTIARMLLNAFAGETLCSVIVDSKSNSQKASDILHARILLALISENWARYMCYSSDINDRRALETLIKCAEESIWLTEALRMEGFGFRTIPTDLEFSIRFVSLISDILFTKARQIDFWKCDDVRREVQPLLQSACEVGDFLFNVIKNENDGNIVPKSFIANKVYGDLVRKSGYYARYVFDDINFFLRESIRLDYQDTINMARNALEEMKLSLPWARLNERKKFCDLLDIRKHYVLFDKQYWDYLMVLWLEYDLRISSFEERKVPPRSWMCNRDVIGLHLVRDPKTQKKTCNDIDPFVVFADMIMSYTEMTWQGNRIKEHELRLLRICRCWAIKVFCEKNTEEYSKNILGIATKFEPRTTKMSSAERLRVAFGTFFKTYIDPNLSRERDEYKLDPLEETSFVKWARSVLLKAERYDRQDVEILRTFIEIVSGDFFSLCKEIQLNNHGDEAKTRKWYLREILKRSGEVSFPWHYEREVKCCVESLHDCQVGDETLPKLQTHEETKSFDEKVVEMSTGEFKKLHALFGFFCKGIGRIGSEGPGQETDIAGMLGLRPQDWANYRKKPNYSCSAERKMKIVRTASRVLHIDRYELIEALFNVDSVVFNSNDAEVNQLMEQFVRTLRNSSTAVDSITSKDVSMVERGLQLYYDNLRMGVWQPTIQEKKIFDLFEEWKMAKQFGERFYETVKHNMRQRPFYGCPTVENWFVRTHLFGAGDSVNILKLGIVGIEMLESVSNLKIGGRPLTQIIVNCCEQLTHAKPDWDGSRVLRDKWESVQHTRRVKYFIR